LPTAAGRALADKARAILADLRDLSEAAAIQNEPLVGTLRLGVIPTVAPYVLPRAIRKVRERYPSLRLLLREGRTEELLVHLRDGSLDLLLVALEADLGDAETLPLFPDPFFLAVPKGHALSGRKRISEKDLDSQAVLLLDDGHCLRDQALSICSRAGANELTDWRASSLTTLVQMVAGGVGVTLIPSISVKVEAGAHRLIDVIPFGARGPARTIGLAWRPSAMRKAEFELFGAAIADSMATQRDRV
jgi:LysR family hydrogen peroxide-inducible transcriptional activator